MIKNKNFVPLFLAMAVVVGIGFGMLFNFKKKPVLFSANNSEAKIKRLIDYINYDYVDKVNTDSLLDDAITKMLSELDPHSVYIPKSELKRITETMQGKFVGIGVSFLMHNDSVAVSDVIKGGPSEKVGIMPGDRIIIAEKDTLFGKYINKKAKVTAAESKTILGNRKVSDAVMKALKGEPNTHVKVTVYRKSDGKIHQYKITRGEVPIVSVPAYYLINNHLGYIKIDRFARTTYKEFKKALDNLINEGMESLVLDLRDNPGGFMDIATKIVDEFLKDGKLIVFTKNKYGEVDKTFATKRGDFENGKVYVLINEGSASASEIVTGALQDNDKGTIVGRRSFGKGLVQQEMDLGDGSAVRLTTSRYYTPTGRSIQKPYNHKDNTAYENDYLNRIHNGELVNKDSIKVDDHLKYKTPKGKIVYGGGGIIPDVFVPIDTTNVFSNRLFGRLNNFVFNYVDTHRNELKKWDLNNFIKSFDKNNRVLNNYIKKIDLKSPISNQSKNKIEIYLKALIARNLFGEVGFLKATQQNDQMIKKVLELDASSSN
ncbi:MAG: S41 family peptidase [Lutibacter sp.]